ncbi:MAG: hypothetical protein R3C69_10185 [Geminicoccaceae bacterium]
MLRLIPETKVELIGACWHGRRLRLRSRPLRPLDADGGSGPAAGLRRQPDAIVVADGTSCRHQIADGARRRALHVVRLLERLLPATTKGGSASA